MIIPSQCVEMTVFGKIILKIARLLIWCSLLDIGAGAILQFTAVHYHLKILTVVAGLLFSKGLFSVFCAFTDKGKTSVAICSYLVIGGLFLLVAEGVVIYISVVECQTVIKVLDEMHQDLSFSEYLYLLRFLIAVFFVICPIYFTSMWIIHYYLCKLYRKLFLMERFNYLENALL